MGVAILAVTEFLAGKRVLYAAPTQDQLERFWLTVTRALETAIQAGIYYKNETKHLIEKPGSEQRIRAKTAWNADTLRGDYADLLILDEYQLMDEDAWEYVGAPMLMDNNGVGIFIYTPPSLRSRSTSKARDPRHAAKLFKAAQADQSGRWKAFHFTSRDNPYVSAEAIDELAIDMTRLAYQMEIEALDIEEAPGALWKQVQIDATRVWDAPPLQRIVVAVDPSVTSTGDEAGIITVGRNLTEGYVLADDSLQGSPKEWATVAVRAYHRHEANLIVAEANNGGEMVRDTIAAIDPTVQVALVTASRGKHTRAEPIAAVYETGRIHHVRVFPALESEMVLWTPGDASPNRLDAMVWGFSYLNMTRQQSLTLTPQEKFELTLPEAVRLTAIETERNPDRIESLIHSREIVINRQKSERAVTRPTVRRRNRLAEYRKLTRRSI